jgi:hypothetical protein
MSTYTPIASVTLSSAQSSVTFSGIPQTYTDLVLVSDMSGSTTFNALLTYNSDSSSNYSETDILGDGTSATSSRLTNQTYIRVGYIDSGRTMHRINVMNYTNSTTNKTTLLRWDTASAGYVDARVGLWRSTSAITSLTLTTSTGNFASGSTFNLYGVANASITNTAKATGGDTITTDGTYWYHTFYSSGTFTPTQALTNVDFLAIAGGGGGYVQGGGAGGYRCSVTGESSGGGGSAESKLSLSAQAYTVTVGAGGSNGNSGVTGSNSSISGSGFTTITSTGGGGTSSGGLNGLTGGSGGGAFNSGTAGSGTANQGYAGGAAPTSSAGGGGGGASAAGTSASGTTGGNGGNGVASSITGTSTTRAGGGAGYGTGSSGSAGSGGGGVANGTSAKNGTANTGGGGAGGGAGNGGIGGSGIVVFRYAV